VISWVPLFFIVGSRIGSSFGWMPLDSPILPWTLIRIKSISCRQSWTAVESPGQLPKLFAPEIAGLALGMHREVANVISGMRIADLERIAKNQFNELMPRWADLGAVWKEILQAAQDNDRHGVTFATLHALQLAAVED
jgi:hypothetical protein